MDHRSDRRLPSSIQLAMTWILFVALFSCGDGVETDGEFNIMISHSFAKKDFHLAHVVPLDTDKAIYITELVSHNDPEFLHHVGIYGCAMPLSLQEYWQYKPSLDDPDNPLCQGKSIFMYSWAHGFPGLKLPEGSGFKLGGDTGLDHFVLEFHFSNRDTFPSGDVGSSGYQVKYTFEPQTLTPSLLWLWIKNGEVQPGQVEHFDVVCLIDEDVVLHPYTIRAHSHSLGVVTTGYRVRDNEWTEIGHHFGRIPSVFSLVNALTLKKGDVLAARCTMYNYKDHVVKLGPSEEDEMCYFEVYYYVDGEKTFSTTMCSSEGPPSYRWENDKNLDPSKIPVDDSAIQAQPNGPDDEHSEHMRHGRRDQANQDEHMALLNLLRRVLPG